MSKTSSELVNVVGCSTAKQRICMSARTRLECIRQVGPQRRQHLDLLNLQHKPATWVAACPAAQAMGKQLRCTQHSRGCQHVYAAACSGIGTWTRKLALRGGVFMHKADVILIMQERNHSPHLCTKATAYQLGATLHILR